jgi:hypothetical protein
LSTTMQLAKWVALVLRPEIGILKNNDFTEKYRKHNLDNI